MKTDLSGDFDLNQCDWYYGLHRYCGNKPSVWLMYQTARRNNIQRSLCEDHYRESYKLYAKKDWFINRREISEEEVIMRMALDF